MSNKTKKIAIIYSGAKHWGGIETYLELLFKNIDKTKVDLTLMSLGDWPLTTKLQATNCQTQLFSASRLNPLAVLQISTHLRQNNFSLVVSQGTVANFYARLVSMYSGVTSLVVVHSDPHYDYPNPLVRTVYATVDKLTRFSTKHYITVSEYLKQKLAKSGIKSNKISVILNGVKDPGQVSRHSSQGWNLDGPIIIGSIGRLHKVKNYSELIRACSLFQTSNFKLQIAGEGSERKNLEKLITELNLSGKVELLGNVENVHELFSSWDIYIQPSLSEGFGLTVVEAMLAGKPVIVSPKGSLPELVENSKTGIVMEGTEAKDISKSITKLVGNTEDAKRLALAGQKSALERFGVGKWLWETEKAYQETAK